MIPLFQLVVVASLGTLALTLPPDAGHFGCAVDLGNCDAGRCALNLGNCVAGGDCSVNGGNCDQGRCLVNGGSCEDRGSACTVNLAWCANGGTCVVNGPAVPRPSAPVGVARCHGGSCAVNLDTCDGAKASCTVNVGTCRGECLVNGPSCIVPKLNVAQGPTAR